MVYIKILKELFPECKVIHIIRDVRDQCLSCMKAWNKDPFLSAQMWSDDIKKCRKDARLYCSANEYFELKYEFLLDNPTKELSEICSFLGIEYEEKMLVLKQPAENLGDTKHNRKIVKENKYKWKTKMSKEMIKKIEMICFDMLCETGYEIAYATSNDRLKYFDFQVARVKDAWNRFKFDCTSQGGFLKAVMYQYMKRKYG